MSNAESGDKTEMTGATGLAANARVQPEANPSAPSERPAAPDAPRANAVSPTEEKASASADAPREVRYVVIPAGLKITVGGVKFTVNASAAQVGAGWGVKVGVIAMAEDGKPHSLASPKAGPLAFGGQVMRAAAKAAGNAEGERFGDERVGDGEQSVFGDDATKFARTWPPRGVRPLGVGDSLDLQVALWGLGTNTESRRPVKKFCHVRMDFGKGKPRPVLEPPADAESAGGS